VKAESKERGNQPGRDAADGIGQTRDPSLGWRLTTSKLGPRSIDVCQLPVPGERLHPKNCHQRKSTWNESNSEGRWRPFTHDDLANRDKLNLDIFWIKDKSLEDAESLPEPDVLAQEIADDLQAAMEQFAAISAELNE
jgi:hypothetical protein